MLTILISQVGAVTYEKDVAVHNVSRKRDQLYFSLPVSSNSVGGNEGNE